MLLHRTGVRGGPAKQVQFRIQAGVALSVHSPVCV